MRGHCGYCAQCNISSYKRIRRQRKMRLQATPQENKPAEWGIITPATNNTKVSLQDRVKSLNKLHASIQLRVQMHKDAKVSCVRLAKSLIPYVLWSFPYFRLLTKLPMNTRPTTTTYKANGWYLRLFLITRDSHRVSHRAFSVML
jgi:hypothetical protein